MTWIQRSLKLAPLTRGFHLVTRDVMTALPELAQCRIGLLHLFIQHTSASVTINENADPDVPADLERSFNALVREDFPYQHTLEGPDDMPAHVKASVLGCAVMIPIRHGQLALGTWQGIYLGEHRADATRRSILATVWGQPA